MTFSLSSHETVAFKVRDLAGFPQGIAGFSSKESMTIHSEAIHAIEHEHELIDGKAFRRMLRELLAVPVDFRTDDQAEDYVLANPYGVANVIEKNTVVRTVFGDRVKG